MRVVAVVNRGNFPGAIPLDRQILRRNEIEHRRQLGGNRFLVAGADALQVAGAGKGQRPHHAVDHRHRDLKAQASRQDALLAQRLEHEIGRDRVLGVAEPVPGIAEADPVDAVLDLKQPNIVAVARHQLLDTVDARRPLDRVEIDMAVENLIGEPQHPGAPLADLAVGNCRKIRAEGAAEGASSHPRPCAAARCRPKADFVPLHFH